MDVTEDIEERMSKLSKRMDNDVLITENKKDFFEIKELRFKLSYYESGESKIKKYNDTCGKLVDLYKNEPANRKVYEELPHKNIEHIERRKRRGLKTNRVQKKTENISLILLSY